MTKQESFKRRVRARMEKTGERYVAARRALLAQVGEHRREWVSPPEFTEEAVVAATGRGWDAWCDRIDAWPGRTEGHKAIAVHLVDDEGVDAWWAQGITVGYERITGIRLPYQRPDGSFTASKSRTVRASADLVRDLLLDEEHRADLFPGVNTELLSKPGSKTIRLGMPSGVALVGATSLADGRCKIAIEHEKLESVESVEEWKYYWSEWLDAIDDER